MRGNRLLIVAIVIVALVAAACAADDSEGAPPAEDGEAKVEETGETLGGPATGDTTAQVDTPPPAGDTPSEDLDRAEVVVAAISRILTIDNMFGGRDVFDDVRVADTIGGEEGNPLQPIELELIAAAVQDSATVTFIPDADALTQELFEASPQGVAIVSIGEVRFESDRAEIDLSMWCGSLCGVWLTYEAVPGPDGWSITGPIGPIAVS